jgi:hypothetical protein
MLMCGGVCADSYQNTSSLLHWSSGGVNRIIVQYVCAINLNWSNEGNVSRFQWIDWFKPFWRFCLFPKRICFRVSHELGILYNDNEANASTQWRTGQTSSQQIVGCCEERNSAKKKALKKNVSNANWNWTAPKCLKTAQHTRTLHVHTYIS